jgi:catechol 2,3-dioxygenase-like lactoylglutathione lyase family enzyme
MQNRKPLRPAHAEATLDHVVFEVVDPSRSVAFYVDVFRFAPVRLEEFRSGAVPFPSARINGASVLDFFPRPMWRGRSARNPNHFCITLDRRGVAAVKRALAQRGVPIDRTDDHNFGALGFGHALYFRDPDGITVEARYYD